MPRWVVDEDSGYGRWEKEPDADLDTPLDRDRIIERRNEAFRTGVLNALQSIARAIDELNERN
jgi:hypothetical protein